MVEEDGTEKKRGGMAVATPLSDVSHSTAGSELPSSVPVSLCTTTTVPISSPLTD
jgi:hypothetical protein